MKLLNHKNFKNYIKNHKHTIIITILSTWIFTSWILLFFEPIEKLLWHSYSWYSFLLSFICMLIYGSIYQIKINKSHKQYQEKIRQRVLKQDQLMQEFLQTEDGKQFQVYKSKMEKYINEKLY